jgi:hypothetical protein
MSVMMMSPVEPMVGQGGGRVNLSHQPGGSRAIQYPLAQAEIHTPDRQGGRCVDGLQQMSASKVAAP